MIVTSIEYEQFVLPLGDELITVRIRPGPIIMTYPRPPLTVGQKPRKPIEASRSAEDEFVWPFDGHLITVRIKPGPIPPVGKDGA